MLVLASTSPRRKELLAHITTEFTTRSVQVDESRQHGESPAAMCVRLALLKAQTAFAQLTAHDHQQYAVLAGDTVVTIDDEVFGKPTDRDHAMAMLQSLSGKVHTVFSAVALISAENRVHRTSSSEVTFAVLPQQRIACYCDTTEPFDKAGAYAIQGSAGAFVTHLNGSYSGVVGLPLWETAQVLREGGVIR